MKDSEGAVNVFPRKQINSCRGTMETKFSERSMPRLHSENRRGVEVSLKSGRDGKSELNFLWSEWSGRSLVPGGITGPPCFWGCEYGDLVL
jgi:hypothetical protein